MDRLKQSLVRAFWLSLAVVFLIESWLWEHVRDGLRALGRRLGVERFDPWLRALVDKLSPPMTLVLFGVPGALIFPFKLIALGLLAKGYIISGIVAIFAAKTLALGVTALLFDICREKLMQMRWFCRFYSLMLAAGAWSHELIAPLRRRVADLNAILRERLAPLKERVLLARRFGVGRRLHRLRAWSVRVLNRSGQRDEV
jgi:hypothetical protein